jgi:hypothetical protein
MIAMPGRWHAHSHLSAPALLLLLLLMLLQVWKAKRNMHNAAEQPEMKLGVTA